MIGYSFKTGFSFGLTSGIITTLGLVVGLYSGTHSKLALVGGILVIAVADAFSDALGIHISEETKTRSSKEIFEASITTFFSKLVFASTFIVPVLWFDLKTAVIISVLWGFLLLAIFSFYMAKAKKAKPWKIILEHLLIAAVVIVLTNILGSWIRSIFR